MGITPSHLIFRSLHASQAKATLRRRRTSVWRAGPRSDSVSAAGSTLLDLDIGEVCREEALESFQTA